MFKRSDFYECHNNAYFLSKEYPDMYLLTSLAHQKFNHPFYHSYNYDKKTNLVYELCLKYAMDKAIYDLIVEPNEIIMIQNAYLPDILESVESKTSQPEDRCKLLKIALYEQLNNLSSEEMNKILAYKNSIIT